MSLPEIVSHEEWRAARIELLAEEKALTRARDALRAKRRMLPMVRIVPVRNGAVTPAQGRSRCSAAVLSRDSRRLLPFRSSGRPTAECRGTRRP